MLLQPFQLVPGQRRGGQLNQPAQHPGHHATGCVHAQVRHRLLVSAEGSSRTQASPLLLPCGGGGGGHGALLPAALLPDGSGCATVLLRAANDPQRGWATPVRLECPVRTDTTSYFTFSPPLLLMSVKVQESSFPCFSFSTAKASLCLRSSFSCPSGRLVFFQFHQHTANSAERVSVAAVSIETFAVFSHVLNI